MTLSSALIDTKALDGNRPILSVATHLRLSSFSTSAVVHASLLLILALMTTSTRVHSTAAPLVSSISATEIGDEFGVEGSDLVQSAAPAGDARPDNVIGSATASANPQPGPFAPADSDLLTDTSFGGLASTAPATSNAGSATGGDGEDTQSTFVGPPGGGLGGRKPGGRGKYAAKRGASQESEDAVERGLHWLAMHQRPDGSWSFDHRGEFCKNECANPGTFPSNNAATGLALLPFLGAGYTHKEGPYTDTMRRGLYFLGKQMIMTPHGGDLHESTMYAQGIATIALCEAYAMTDDAGLKPYAQAAVDFIVSAQDKNGGGWRYTPGQPGDTTVFGWQIMALRSAQLAHLRVPSPTWSLAEKFLDSVQGEYGSAYGYQSPAQATQTTTAIGLLCRMYTGWERQRPGLVKGVGNLDKLGPSPQDMYYNYYATQVVHHFEGASWPRWNKKMRDYLVATQANLGHETGSWYFADKHADVAGRLYTTCMAIMTLEVYYRYLPLYEREAVKQ
jgi:hypothetical protein